MFETTTAENACTLSVIIPVYRVEATLQRCVKSVLKQPYDDIEVILVDDGSPDACPQMCDEWAAADPRVRVIHKPNGGLSDARNAGIDVVRGQWLTFVDSDDFIRDDTYVDVMRVASPDVDIVEFPLYRHYGTLRQQLVTFPDGDYTDMGHYWLQARAYEHCYAWNKVYRRELFTRHPEVRFPAGEVFEDVSLLPRLLQHVGRVRTTSRGLYFYCANAEGITATARGPELAQLLENHLKVIGRWCDDRYFMHVLNIQMDVSELTGRPPRLPLRRELSPWSKNLSNTERLKALIVKLLGIKGICRINRIIHKLTRRSLRTTRSR